MEKSSKTRHDVAVAIILGLVAALLYGVFISLNFASPGGGEGRIANAFATLGAWAALWVFLLVLLAIDRVRAGQKSWTARAAILFVPVAGIAVLFATDYPGDALCALSVVALPLLVLAYLLLGALARLRATSQPWRTKALLMLMTAALSIWPIVRFAS